MATSIRLSQGDIFRLAAEASRNPQTVKAVLAGHGKKNFRSAVLQAAKRLGLARAVKLLSDGQPFRSETAAEVRADALPVNKVRGT